MPKQKKKCYCSQGRANASCNFRLCEACCRVYHKLKNDDQKECSVIQHRLFEQENNIDELCSKIYPKLKKYLEENNVTIREKSVAEESDEISDVFGSISLEESFHESKKNNLF